MSDFDLEALLDRCRAFFVEHPAMWFICLVVVVVVLTLAGF